MDPDLDRDLSQPFQAMVVASTISSQLSTSRQTRQRHWHRLAPPQRRRRLFTLPDLLLVRAMSQGLDTEVEVQSGRAMSLGLDTEVEVQLGRATSLGLDTEVEVLSVRVTSLGLDTEVEVVAALARVTILVPALALQPAPRPGSPYLMAIQHVRRLAVRARTVVSIMAHRRNTVRITAILIMLVLQLTSITGQIVELLRKGGAIATLILRFQEYVQRVALAVVTSELSNVWTSALQRAQAVLAVAVAVARLVQVTSQAPVTAVMTAVAHLVQHMTQVQVTVA